MAKVAMIGLGRMGAAMARRFHDAGHDLIVWNRDRTKAEGIAADTGAAIAESPAAAAARAEFVVSSLADDAALRAVYLDVEGVARGIGDGTIAIDTSTVDPSTIIEIGEAIGSTNGRFIDCPVSGSVSTVESGALTIMAGGEPDLVGEVEPILSAIAQKVVRVGDLGAGAACKLAVNGLLHSLNVALSEALVLAEKAGVEREAAYEVFASGAAGAPYVHYKRDAFEHPESATVAFTLDLVGKDLDLITALGDRVGAPLEQAKVTREIVRRAVADGMGDADLSAVATHLRAEEG